MKTLNLLLFLITSIITQAENIIETQEHKHTHSKEEIGLALSPIFTTETNEWAMGMHLHYTYRIFPNLKFAIGASYEHIFDEHKHHFFGIIGSYSPIEHMHISLVPGLSFEGDESAHKHFGMHAEFLYEFAIKQFHLGPVLEVAYEKGNSHVGLGIHFGFGF